MIDAPGPKALFTAKQEYCMYLLLRQKSKRWISKYLETNEKVNGLPRSKVLQALENGWAIKPKSVKIKEFGDISSGMLAMEIGCKRQYRIDRLSYIEQFIGAETVGYGYEGMHFNYSDYGKTWCIAGDQYDQWDGEVFQQKKEDEAINIPHDAEEKPSKQALELELDYELASLYDAMNQGNSTEVERSKARLTEIYAEIDSLAKEQRRLHYLQR